MRTPQAHNEEIETPRLTVTSQSFYSRLSTDPHPPQESGVGNSAKERKGMHNTMHRRLTYALSIQPRPHFLPRLLSRFLSSHADPNIAFLYEQLERTIAHPVANTSHSHSQSPQRLRPLKEVREGEDKRGGSEVVISHQWPEWVGLMDLLVKKEYLDLVRLDDLNHVRTVNSGDINVHQQ